MTCTISVILRYQKGKVSFLEGKKKETGFNSNKQIDFNGFLTTEPNDIAEIIDDMAGMELHYDWLEPARKKCEVMDSDIEVSILKSRENVMNCLGI